MKRGMIEVLVLSALFLQGPIVNIANAMETNQLPSLHQAQQILYPNLLHRHRGPLSRNCRTRFGPAPRTYYARKDYRSVSLDQTVAFTIKSPDLFKGLSVGGRIAVRLDDQGQVVKVMETTVPELPIPTKSGDQPRLFLTR